jgi:type IV pilus assembly protein PilE
MKKSAFTLIELMIVVALIAIAAALALPGFLSSMKSGRETSAIGSLRAICSASVQYNTRNGSYADGLATLNAEGYLSANLALGTKDDYTFEYKNATKSTYECYAVPDTNSSGDLTFFIDESSLLRYANGIAATENGRTWDVYE